MDGYSTTIFIFLALIVGQITYFIVPSLPISILAAVSAVAIAAVLLWHWTQFSVEYRLSTWQEGLRNYASYILVFIVIILSYGYYVFSTSGGSLAAVAQQTQATIRNAGRNAMNKSSRVLSSIGLQSSAPAPSPVMAPTPNAGFGAGLGAGLANSLKNISSTISKNIL